MKFKDFKKMILNIDEEKYGDHIVYRPIDDKGYNFTKISQFSVNLFIRRKSKLKFKDFKEMILNIDEEKYGDHIVYRSIDDKGYNFTEIRQFSINLVNTEEEAILPSREDMENDEELFCGYNFDDLEDFDKFTKDYKQAIVLC